MKNSLIWLVVSLLFLVLSACHLLDDSGEKITTTYAINKKKDAGKPLDHTALKDGLSTSEYHQLLEGITASELDLLSYGMGTSNVITLINAIGSAQKLVDLLSDPEKVTVEEALSLFNNTDANIIAENPPSTDTLGKIAVIINGVNNMTYLKRLIHGVDQFGNFANETETPDRTDGIDRLSLFLALMDETSGFVPNMLNAVMPTAAGEHKLIALINKTARIKKLAQLVNEVTASQTVIDLINVLGPTTASSHEDAYREGLKALVDTLNFMTTNTSKLATLVNSLDQSQVTSNDENFEGAFAAAGGLTNAGFWALSADNNHFWEIATDGSKVLRVPASLTHGETAIVELMISLGENFAGGNLSYAYKISSEPNADKGRFFVDDVLKASYSGATEFVTETIVLPAKTSGIFRLRWEYQKDDSGDGGTDTFTIDNLVLPGDRSGLLPHQKVAVLLNKLDIAGSLTLAKVMDGIDVQTGQKGAENLGMIVNKSQYPFNLNEDPRLLTLVNALDDDPAINSTLAIKILTDILNSLPTAQAPYLVALVDYAADASYQEGTPPVDVPDVKKLAKLIRELSKGQNSGAVMSELMSNITSHGVANLLRMTDAPSAAVGVGGIEVDSLVELITNISVGSGAKVAAILNALSAKGRLSSEIAGTPLLYVGAGKLSELMGGMMASNILNVRDHLAALVNNLTGGATAVAMLVSGIELDPTFILDSGGQPYTVVPNGSARLITVIENLTTAGAFAKMSAFVNALAGNNPTTAQLQNGINNLLEVIQRLPSNKLVNLSTLLRDITNLTNMATLVKALSGGAYKVARIIETASSTGLTNLRIAVDAIRDATYMATLIDSIGGGNVARGKTATQSITYGSQAAALAVDGKTEGTYAAGVNVAIADIALNAWWQVDLQQSYKITGLKIFKRTDCCSTRLNDFALMIDGTVVPGYEHVMVSDAAPIIMTIPGITGQTVKIRLNGTNYVELAEVQIFVTGNNTGVDNVVTAMNNMTALGAQNFVTIMEKMVDTTGLSIETHLAALVDELTGGAVAVAQIVSGLTTQGINTMVTLVYHLRDRGTGEKYQNWTDTQTTDKYGRLIQFVDKLTAIANGVLIMNTINPDKVESMAKLVSQVYQVKYMEDLVNGVQTTADIITVINNLNFTSMASTTDSIAKMLEMLKLIEYNTGDSLTISGHMVRLVDDLRNSSTGARMMADVINQLSTTAIDGYTGTQRIVIIMGYLAGQDLSNKYDQNWETHTTDPFGRFTTFMNSLTGANAAYNTAYLINNASYSRLDNFADLVKNTTKVRYMTEIVNNLTNVSLLTVLLNATALSSGTFSETTLFTQFQQIANQAGAGDGTSNNPEYDMSKLTSLVNELAAGTPTQQKSLIDIVHDIRYCGINEAYDLNAPWDHLISPNPGCNGTPYVRMSQFLFGSTPSSIKAMAITIAGVVRPIRMTYLVNGVRDHNAILYLFNNLPGEYWVALLNNLAESASSATLEREVIYGSFLYLGNKVPPTDMAKFMHWGSGVPYNRALSASNCMYFTGAGPARVARIMNAQVGTRMKPLLDDFGIRTMTAALGCGFGTPNVGTPQYLPSSYGLANQAFYRNEMLYLNAADSWGRSSYNYQVKNTSHCQGYYPQILDLPYPYTDEPRTDVILWAGYHEFIVNVDAGVSGVWGILMNEGGMATLMSWIGTKIPPPSPSDATIGGYCDFNMNPPAIAPIQ